MALTAPGKRKFLGLDQELRIDANPHQFMSTRSSSYGARPSPIGTLMRWV